MVTNATFLTCHVVVVVTALKIRVCAKNVWEKIGGAPKIEFKFQYHKKNYNFSTTYLKCDNLFLVIFYYTQVKNNNFIDNEETSR